MQRMIIFFDFTIFKFFLNVIIYNKLNFLTKLSSKKKKKKIQISLILKKIFYFN